MKFLNFINVLVALFVFLSACDPYKVDIPEWDYGKDDPSEQPGKPGEGGSDEDYPVKYPDPSTPKVKTLLTEGLFRETKVKDGITLYSFEQKKEEVSNAVQTVFVLEVDLNNKDYKVNFFYCQSDTTSAVAKRQKAIAAVNACYEMEAIYCKVNGNVLGTVTLDPDHLRYWKHEAAIVGDGKRKIGMVHGAKGTNNHKQGGLQALEIYESLTEKNIYASSPMLIDDFEPVGAYFVPDIYSASDLNKLDAEDYRRHQGGRNPRVAVALTDDNDLLLVVVDGRFSGKAEGMTAKELTNFLVKHFNPRWAINMDGGGSSTMYINGLGDPVNNVLNYPCDNKKWDHYGQRKRPTYFLIQYDE